jgi:hypothetical protein
MQTALGQERTPNVMILAVAMIVVNNDYTNYALPSLGLGGF